MNFVSRYLNLAQRIKGISNEQPEHDILPIQCRIRSPSDIRERRTSGLGDAYIQYRSQPEYAKQMAHILFPVIKLQAIAIHQRIMEPLTFCIGIPDPIERPVALGISA